jgi:hypothetical protein
MAKGTRAMHIELSDTLRVNTDDIQVGLQRLVDFAADSDDFEEILNLAVHALYVSLPNGNKKYGAKRPEVGQVWISRLNCAEGAGKANIEFVPSDRYKSHFKNIYDPATVAATIGMLDLRERIYHLRDIPAILYLDTIKVFSGYLGLSRKR